MIFEKENAQWYNTRPTFGICLSCPCPYIWFGWWLITWVKPVGIPSEQTGIKSLSISYLPD